MNDIAKMRQEMERKIKEAELENQFEEKVGFHGSILGESVTQKGKTRLCYTKLTKEQVQKLLKMFPSTEKAKRTRSATDKSVLEMNYILETHRYPKEVFTKLEIEWIHGDYAIDVDMPIMPDDEVLMGYFKQDYYEIDDSSVGLYYGAVRSNRDIKSLKRQRVLSFNCGSQIRYNSGWFLQTSEGHADCIVAEIIGE